ncbi:hypothetical protein SLS58_005155 [Diplodia intermedia]|uniref:Potassium transport protein n=1 Tax=Diplodia intermedia TaxID=856260 RepID=A0ABR3TRP0_9PEZI
MRKYNAYIVLAGIVGFIVIYPYGNLRAVDAYFFGVSATTESGLNTVDVNALKTYQQLVIYFLPIVTNLGFINIIVVIVRLHWFEKRLKEVAPTLLHPSPADTQSTAVEKDVEAQVNRSRGRPISEKPPVATGSDTAAGRDPEGELQHPEESNTQKRASTTTAIAFAEGTRPPPSQQKALRVPSPRERERGQPLEEANVDVLSDEDGDDIDKITRVSSSEVPANGGLTRRRTRPGPSMPSALSIENVASSMFVLGADPTARKSSHSRRSASVSRSSMSNAAPYLSREATIGRNSQFYNLSAEDREQLGGIEYRSLKLLLKIVTGYFFGLHLFGAICLAGWIQTANSKYRDYLAECGQDQTWWGIYSAQTMISNLGFTLTPDSMISFQDATFPLLVMTFLAYAGNTCYPILLRLLIWTFSKLVPRHSSTQAPLRFLLDHPRRCYTLLFPARTTWILFGTLVALNAVDTLLIVVLDLHNASAFPPATLGGGGARVLAALYQAASARHTGTAAFNLAAVHPAVQFSLVVMMYISVFPLAMSVRASNTYEEQSLSLRAPESDFDDGSTASYLRHHLRNQLGFDLWYISVGVFCITVAEADRVADPADPAFQIFSILFEVVSAYANVGLSLGYPTVMTSLSGQFSTFSKLVICAMMIRGRHRGLPYALDRAIVLPGDVLRGGGDGDGGGKLDGRGGGGAEVEGWAKGGGEGVGGGEKIKRAYTS